MRSVGAIAAVVLAGFAWGQSLDDRARKAAAERTNEALVADLADDDVPLNALEAMQELGRRGRSAMPALETALRSADWQQRQIAAEILRAAGGDAPSTALLEVTIEGLKDDGMPIEIGQGGGRWHNHVKNADRGVQYLLAHHVSAREALRRGVESEDGQQRFLCAYILATSGEVGDIAGVVRVLTAHLHDNKIDGDAVMAASALYRLGRMVISHLQGAPPAADVQARELIQLIVLDLTDAPEDKEQLGARRKMQRITELYDDPVIQAKFGYPAFWWPPR